MIYFDNNSTTLPSPGVVAAMRQYLETCYFNGSSSTAALTGADKPIKDAANALAKLLKAEEPENFIFTSGATEANNWVFDSITKLTEPGRIIISSIEHPSVYEPAAEMQGKGYEIVEVPVDENGVLHLDHLASVLTTNTRIVSVMAANNETGVLQPLQKIGEIIRSISPAAIFHTDATQAIGKVRLELEEDLKEIDLLTFSAHKFHGPKGIGGIYIRPGIELMPFLLGGAQQRGLRSGTLNIPAIAGLATAVKEIDFSEINSVRLLRDYFESSLEKACSPIFYSRAAPRIANTSCFSLPGISASDLVYRLACKGYIVATGAACSSGAIQPPKTVLAIGAAYDDANSTLRVSISKFTTPEEINGLVGLLIELSEEIAITTFVRE